MVTSSKKFNIHLNFITFTTFNRLPRMDLHARTNTAAYCENTIAGHKKRGLKMYVQWKGMLTTEAPWADKAT
jgi:hypothetical protein